jgi:hypothetical protein
MTHPHASDELRWNREILESAGPDTQQLVVYLPADDVTGRALSQLRAAAGQTTRLRVV